MDVRLETGHVFLRENVRDNFSLARMFGTVACVEKPSTNADERIIKVRLQKPGAMTVDDRDRRWIRDRQVVRRDADIGACAEQIFEPTNGNVR